MKIVTCILLISVTLASTHAGDLTVDTLNTKHVVRENWPVYPTTYSASRVRGGLFVPAA